MRNNGTFIACTATPPNKSWNTHPCLYQSETATDQVQISYASYISMHSNECDFLPGTEMCVFKSCPFCSIKHNNVTHLACTVWLSDIPLIITLKHQQWEIWGESYVNYWWNKVCLYLLTRWVILLLKDTLPSCLPRLTELLANTLWATAVALYSVVSYSCCTVALYSVLALHLLGYRAVHHADNSDVDNNGIKRAHHDLWSHIYNKQSYIRTNHDWQLVDGCWVCSVTIICTFHLHILEWVTSNIEKFRYKILNLL